MKNALWFLAGCVLTFVVTYAAIKPKTDNSSAASQSTIAQLLGQQATDRSSIAQLRSQQADLTKQRDTCNAKFERVTVLYDVGLFNIETKAWAIPADIDPVLVTGKNGNYSHYDPKTQMETVHFKGKAAQ